MSGVNGIRGRRAFVVGLLLATAGAVTAQPAHAQGGGSVVNAGQTEFDIPAQAATEALIQFGRQAGMRVSSDAALVSGVASPGVRGTMTPARALSILLTGTGLTFRISGNTVTIERAPQAADGTVQLGPVRVEGEGAGTAGHYVVEESGIGLVVGYVARRSATATKTDTPIIEAPRSVTVISRDLMEAQGALKWNEAIRYTAGTLTDVTGFDPRDVRMTLRGFYQDFQFQDGMRLFASGDYSAWIVEPQNLERIEILRGPSLLYGQGSPGGMINFVTKRPALDAPSSVDLTIGSFGQKQAAFDIGDALNEGNTILFRVNGLARDAGTQTKFVNDDRFFISPAITVLPGDRLSVTILADLTRDHTKNKGWFPTLSLLQSNPNGKLPRNLNTGDPNFERDIRNGESIESIIEYRPDNFVIKQTARYSHSDLKSLGIYAGSLDATGRVMSRGTWEWNFRGEAFTADTSVQRTFKTGLIEHRIIAGLDYQWFKLDGEEGYGDAPSLDLFAPVYGLPFSEVPTYPVNGKLRQTGVYLQDQIAYQNWRLTLGIRHDWAHTFQNYDGSISDQKDRHTSYTAGLLYASPKGISPYITWSNSFMPLLGENPDGVAFRPQTSRQVEVGIKYEPPGVPLRVTVALFDIRKQNVPTPGDRPGYSRQTGEVRSRGFEAEIIGNPIDAIEIMGSYTHLDPEISRSSVASEIGKQPIQTARDTAALWVNIHPAITAQPGLSFGAGVRYVGRVPASPNNLWYNPAYTLVDAAVRYENDRYAIALNASNLFDNVYIANRGNFYGQERTVRATFSYKW